MKTYPPALCLFVLLASAPSLVGTAMTTADFPKDTSTIDSLAPEQTARLVERFRGGALGLDGLTRLDAATAQALAAGARDAGRSAAAFILSLGGLTALDADAARALVAFKGGQLTLGGRAALAGPAAGGLAVRAADPSRPDATR